MAAKKEDLDFRPSTRSVREYIGRKMALIDGQIRKDQALILAFLQEVQKKHSIKGNFLVAAARCERVAFMMFQFRRTGEKVTALVVPADKTAKDEADPLALFQHAAAELGITEGMASYRLDIPEEGSILAPNAGSNMRMIFVDCEGDEAAVKMNLQTAVESLSKDGVLICQGFFNPRSAHATELILDLLHEQVGEIAAFMISANMIFLCRKRSYGRYYNEIGDTFGRSRKTAQLSGRRVRLLAL